MLIILTLTGLMNIEKLGCSSMVERVAVNDEVVGSNPTFPAKFGSLAELVLARD